MTSQTRQTGRAATLVLAGVLALASLPASAVVAERAENPWLEHRVMNMPHSGGEDEAPTNTMYAFERALRKGGDMIELDVQSTRDDRLVVLHNATVDASTNGTGRVEELTWREVRRLDAAHWFIRGRSHSDHDARRSAYELRGARYGDVRVRGHQPRDFGIPLLRHVFRAFPDTPVNIEIKGTADSDVESFLHNAELLARFLNRRDRTDVIVASFQDAALAHFHELAPQIPLSAGTAAMVAYFSGGVPLPEGTVALQAPVRYQGVPVISREFVERAHADGYAVHAWFSGTAPDDRRTYNAVIDACVDGLMPSRPAMLERMLQRRDIERPGEPSTGRCDTPAQQSPRWIHPASSDPVPGSVQAGRGGVLPSG